MVTLREVAERAGVSIKTVSRIVNDDAAVKADTRARVQRHISKLQYVPNNAARVMRGAASTVLGFMTDVVATTPYSVDIVRGAQAALKDTQQTLLIANSEGDFQREQELWRLFRAHRVSGVIYASMFHRSYEVGRPGFDKSIVLANCFAAKGNRPSIIPDDEEGGYRQARYLIELGHRNIVAITLIADLEATKLRDRGIRRAFAEAGLSMPANGILRGVTGHIGGENVVAREIARKVLSRKNRPSAIICGNDQLAMSVYAAAASLGLSIPQDVSVIGFDDLRMISETLYPQLTTVALPYFEIGRLAVGLVTSANGDDMDRRQVIRVPCPLVERQSCRAWT